MSTSKEYELTCEEIIRVKFKAIDAAIEAASLAIGGTTITTETLLESAKKIETFILDGEQSA